MGFHNNIFCLWIYLKIDITKVECVPVSVILCWGGSTKKGRRYWFKGCKNLWKHQTLWQKKNCVLNQLHLYKSFKKCLKLTTSQLFYCYNRCFLLYFYALPLSPLYTPLPAPLLFMSFRPFPHCSITSPPSSPYQC